MVIGVVAATTIYYIDVYVCTFSGSDECVYIASEFLAFGALILALVLLL